MSWVDLLLRNLLWTSLTGGLLIGGVWLLCRLAPRLPAGVRCGLWWLACAKLLVGLVWLTPFSLPLLPAPSVVAEAAAPAVAVLQPPAATLPVASLRASVPPSPRLAGGEGGPGLAGSWQLALALFWLAVVAAQLAWTAGEVRRTRRLVARSASVGGRIRSLFERLAARVGLATSPELRASPEVASPQAVGLTRPVVLLPEHRLSELSAQELEMTLCHELLHVRRRDLWLGWLPTVAQRLFFFHPLAAVAAREYALAREAACDAEVLRVLGSAPQAYGRLLLRLGVAPRETGLAAAGASPTLGNLKRRLHMLQHTSDDGRQPRRWSWLVAAAAVAALVPIQIGAQAPKAPKPPKAPAAPRAVEAPVPPAAPTPKAVPAPVPAPPPPAPMPDLPSAPDAVAPVPPVPAPSAHPMPAPAPPEPPLAPPPPLAALAPSPLAAPEPLAPTPAPAPRAAVQAPPAPPAPPASPKPRMIWKESNRKSDGFVFLFDGDTQVVGGTWLDAEQAEKLSAKGERLLWFRRDGKSYVVRDPATLRNVQEILEPQIELGRKQGELGALQGRLGNEQHRLGALQGDLGGRQGDLGAKQAALASRSASGRNDQSLERRQRELGQEMGELGRKQAELGALQAELGRQQAELGRQQSELGRQQQEAAEKAEKELGSLIDRAIQSGLAKEGK